MKEIIRIIVQVVHVLSICGSIFTGMIGVLYEIIGHAKFEQLFSAIGISKGFERVWIISAIMFMLFIITYFVKAKFFN